MISDSPAGLHRAHSIQYGSLGGRHDHEPRRTKMVIQRQRFAHPAFRHHLATHRVREREKLVMIADLNRLLQGAPKILTDWRRVVM